MACHIIGYGTAFPERIVRNDELAPLLGVTPEWIETSSGIRERRWAAPEQSASDLAASAVKSAAESGRIEIGSLDYLIGGTLSPDYQVPGIAPLVQRKLDGCRNVPAVDLRVGCVGILYGLQLAKSLVESGAARTVACFGAEAQSKGLDLSPEAPELNMLFGDGAGACIVSREPNPNVPSLLVEDVLIASDGAFAEDLVVRAPGTANGARWLDAEHMASKLHHGSMNGRAVILHAVRKMSDAATEVLRRNDVCLDQIDVIVPHQANANLLRQLAKRLGVSEERVVSNIARYGNTSGASAFIALHQSFEEKRLSSGTRVLIAAFGAGFTWGAALCRAT